MSFVSLPFLVLLGSVCLIYRRLGHAGQNLLLLAASYLFYAWWDWRFLGLIVLSSLVDYRCGIALDRQASAGLSERARRAALLISVGVNLGLLGFFKYFGFFVESARAALGGLGAGAGLGLPWGLDSLDIVLPVGISFYTFQTMSYTIDVYRGELRCTRKLTDFLLFVAFFPQLVAGPIERASSLLPQIQAPRTRDASASALAMATGAQLALLGFFKKMVVADNLAPFVDSVYRQDSAPGALVVLATYAFAFQIYADFSGYTDIARGVARMLGFDIRRNFRIPYLATSPSDFWQRWHISLSSWLRDYLYIPLGGNRGGGWATARNLLITMLLGGLWHGAAWTYVVWGAYHGLLLGLFRPARGSGADRPRLPRPLAVAGFFQLTCVGWLIFRARDAAQIASFGKAVVTELQLSDLPGPSLLLVALYAAPLILLDTWRALADHPEPWTGLPAVAQAAFLLAASYAIVLLGTPHATPFLYFQF